MCRYPTPYRGSTEALPYNFTETLLVGEGLAPPENLSVQRHPQRSKSTFIVGYGIYDVPRPIRQMSYIAEQINYSVGMVIDHPRMTGVSVIENVR